MTHEKTEGRIRHTRLSNESRDYLEKREELRYNIFDLTPHGRGNWYARLGYGTKVHWGVY